MEHKMHNNDNNKRYLLPMSSNWAKCSEKIVVDI